MSVGSFVRRNPWQYNETIETLRHRVPLADFDSRLKSLMITSAFGFEGRPAIASHLAVANAKGVGKSLLIGWLCQPDQPQSLGLARIYLV